MKAKWFNLIVLVLAATVAWADWDPDVDPAKWVQMPDLTDEGMDVKAVNPLVLADDFECKERGHIHGIHIWASWYKDRLPYYEVPYAVAFRLQIWSDVPATAESHSHPGELLWQRTYQAGDFVVQQYAQNLQEGWMDPPQNFYDPQGDTVCWQYNFDIQEQPFLQEGTPERPIIYWLAVTAQPEDDVALFGWKSSRDHWNDDAVWSDGTAAPLWRELRYIPDHPLQGKSVDLAFVIQSDPIPVPEDDFGDAPEAAGALWQYPTLLPNGARHKADPAMVLGANIDMELNGIPTIGADGDDLNQFVNDEDGVALPPALYPGFPATVIITASMDGKLDAWCDFGADGTWNASDQIFAGEPLSAGNNTKTFWVPGTANVGAQTYLRFRYSSVGGLPQGGPADDGEVEDYTLMIEYPGEAADLGDAPDSSNSYSGPVLMPMTAYPGVQADFPTVFAMGSPPWGPIHWNPKPVHFGHSVSLEVEADTGPDQDIVNNLDVPNDSPDQDRQDDGVLNLPLNLPHCSLTQFEYLVYTDGSMSNQQLYVNVWFDWNRDGDWNDTIPCAMACSAGVTEWAVQNQVLVGLPTGITTITTPGFCCWHPLTTFTEELPPIWMRITIAEEPWSTGLVYPGSGGSGPPNGYSLGETEDYIFVPDSSCVRCADLNCDRFVNLLDLNVMANQWLTYCPLTGP